jgi:hypothetical protein
VGPGAQRALRGAEDEVEDEREQQDHDDREARDRDDERRAIAARLRCRVGGRLSCRRRVRDRRPWSVRAGRAGWRRLRGADDPGELARASRAGRGELTWRGHWRVDRRRRRRIGRRLEWRLGRGRRIGSPRSARHAPRWRVVSGGWRRPGRGGLGAGHVGSAEDLREFAGLRRGFREVRRRRRGRRRHRAIGRCRVESERRRLGGRRRRPTSGAIRFTGPRRTRWRQLDAVEVATGSSVLSTIRGQEGAGELAGYVVGRPAGLRGRGFRSTLGSRSGGLRRCGGCAEHAGELAGFRLGRRRGALRRPGFGSGDRW